MNDDFPPTPKNCLSIIGLVVAFFVGMLVVCPYFGWFLWHIPLLKPVVRFIGWVFWDGSALTRIAGYITIGVLVGHPFIKSEH